MEATSHREQSGIHNRTLIISVSAAPFQVVARHEDLLSQATGIESLEGKVTHFYKPAF